MTSPWSTSKAITLMRASARHGIPATSNVQPIRVSTTCEFQGVCMTSLFVRAIFRCCRFQGSLEDLDPRVLHHLAPVCDLRLDVRGELGRRAAGGLRRDLCEG